MFIEWLGWFSNSHLSVYKLGFCLRAALLVSAVIVTEDVDEVK